jgi:outer membrane protein assembly factor BamD (BamD/ComL family)
MTARSSSCSWLAMGLVAVVLMGSISGCLPRSLTSWFRKDSAMDRPFLPPDADTSPSKVNGELAAAHELFRKQDYGAAARAFERIADNKENSAAVAEEALFYQAECERLRDRLVAAEPIYKKILHDFPSGAYKQQACQRLYDIAVFWLKDTDEELGQYAEKLEGKRSFVMPASLRINLDKRKPTFDAEGRAIQALEVVHYSDMTGPLADKALFLAGFVKFYREDYKEADHYFTALLQFHKDSELAPRAIEMAIRAKTLASGGAEYDGRRVAEARQLIDTALSAYPVLAQTEEGRRKMTEHLYEVTAVQAEKELRRAEFYERTNHPGSAYFVYQRIKQRYPQTKFEQIADERLARLQPLIEKEQARQTAEDDSVWARFRRRWDRLWGIEGERDGPALTSPLALPAGSMMGR